jgi:hypothetical protein
MPSDNTQGDYREPQYTTNTMCCLAMDGLGTTHHRKDCPQSFAYKPRPISPYVTKREFFAKYRKGK